jgi:hypothetical protein
MNSLNRVLTFLISLIAIAFTQQDTIIYNINTGNYTIYYTSEKEDGNGDTLITMNFIPATKIKPAIISWVNFDSDSNIYIYYYKIMNGEGSRQNLYRFILRFGKNIEVSDRSTNGWRSSRRKASKNGVYGAINEWVWSGDQGLEANWSVNGFTLASEGIPGIGDVFFRGRGGSILNWPYGWPDHKMEEKIYLLDRFPNNYVRSKTLVPVSILKPFKTEAFADTILQYISDSHILNWIRNESASDKYLHNLQNVKLYLQQNNNPAAINILDSVLTDVEADSGITLTSEAYALIKYNTEYLKKYLEENPE